MSNKSSATLKNGEGGDELLKCHPSSGRYILYRKVNSLHRSVAFGPISPEHLQSSGMLDELSVCRSSEIYSGQMAKSGNRNMWGCFVYPHASEAFDAKQRLSNVLLDTECIIFTPDKLQIQAQFKYYLAGETASDETDSPMFEVSSSDVQEELGSTLLIDNIPANILERDLIDHFPDAKCLFLARIQESTHLGFAFAVYASAQEAEAAIKALKAAGPIVFAGKTVRVQQYKSVDESQIENAEDFIKHNPVSQSFVVWFEKPLYALLKANQSLGNFFNRYGGKTVGESADEKLVSVSYQLKQRAKDAISYYDQHFGVSPQMPPSDIKKTTCNPDEDLKPNQDGHVVMLLDKWDTSKGPVEVKNIVLPFSKMGKVVKTQNEDRYYIITYSNKSNAVSAFKTLSRKFTLIAQDPKTVKPGQKRPQEAAQTTKETPEKKPKLAVQKKSPVKTPVPQKKTPVAAKFEKKPYTPIAGKRGGKAAPSLLTMNINKGRGGASGRGSPASRGGFVSRGSPAGRGGFVSRGSPAGRGGFASRGSPASRGAFVSRGGVTGHGSMAVRGGVVSREGMGARGGGISQLERDMREVEMAKQNVVNRMGRVYGDNTPQQEFDRGMNRGALDGGQRLSAYDRREPMDTRDAPRSRFSGGFEGGIDREPLLSQGMGQRLSGFNDLGADRRDFPVDSRSGMAGRGIQDSSMNMGSRYPINRDEGGIANRFNDDDLRGRQSDYGMGNGRSSFGDSMGQRETSLLGDRPRGLLGDRAMVGSDRSFGASSLGDAGFSSNRSALLSGNGRASTFIDNNDVMRGQMPRQSEFLDNGRSEEFGAGFRSSRVGGLGEDFNRDSMNSYSMMKGDFGNNAGLFRGQNF
eukprot:GHVU01162134.1.p1 GENE.GHVU01162134.1~~GHVU01162134.1.p1  ORF type:complete len:861 (-),score=94.18 GHVU01162134.1:567-3149(-)